MIPVIDQSGVIVPGVFRNAHGALVIDNEEQYKVALEQKKRIEAEFARAKRLEEEQTAQAKSINNLTNEVLEIKTLISGLITALNK